jgi:hypothetical protein
LSFGGSSCPSQIYWSVYDIFQEWLDGWPFRSINWFMTFSKNALMMTIQISQLVYEISKNCLMMTIQIYRSV